MTVHYDNLGQQINPGDVVISVRSSTNYVPRMLVLDLTNRRVKTDGGYYEPATLVVVTKIIQETNRKQYDDLIAAHGSQVVLQVTARPPKMVTRYLLLEMYPAGAVGYCSATHVAILEITYSTAAEYDACRQTLIANLLSDGWAIGSLCVNSFKGSSKRFRSAPRDWGWAYARSTDACRHSAKTLRELNISELPVNQAIAVAEFNAVADPQITYERDNLL